MYHAFTISNKQFRTKGMIPLFSKSLERNDEGHFIVTIPLKQSPEKLKTLYENAKNAFFHSSSSFQI